MFDTTPFESFGCCVVANVLDALCAHLMQTRQQLRDTIAAIERVLAYRTLDWCGWTKLVFNAIEVDRLSFNENSHLMMSHHS